nr:hypothetical protein [Sphingomonas lenta]
MASHLGISVADCAIIENDSGDTFFGSLSPRSVADEVELAVYLTRAQHDETGRPFPWLGRYLAGLWTYDLFIDNPDRTLRNFVLYRDGGLQRICGIDFAAARMLSLQNDRFPVDNENTVKVGRTVRNLHGIHLDSAYEMLSRIAAVPGNVVQRILGEMPEDWIDREQKEGLSDAWSDARRNARIASLQARITHEWQI